MRKPVARICIGLVVFVILLILLLLWPQASAPALPSSALKAASEGLDQVFYDLVFHPEENALSVTMEWAYTNRGQAPLTDIVLRLYPKAFEKEDTSPAATEDIRALSYPNGFSPSQVTVHDLYWNGVPASYAFDAKDETVLRFSIPELAPNAQGTVRLRCVLSLPDCRYMFGRSNHVWMLGRCLPFVADRGSDGWQTSPYPLIGDPLGPAPANCRLSLTMPKSFTCAAPIQWQETAADDVLHLTGAIPAARDITLVLSDRFQTKKSTVDGVIIQSYAENAGDAEKALRFAEKALRFYAKEYGSYPYPTYTVVSAPLPFDGAESTALSMISTARYADESRLELALAHETAHQWFGMLVGSDPILNAWQDEALCEFALMQYVRRTHGQDAYDQLAFLRADAPMRECIRKEITVGSPVDRFQSYDEYGTLVYGRGLSMLLSLARDMDMDAFLKHYITAFAWKTASREDFEKTLCDAAGWDVRPLITDFLDTAI